MKYLLSALVLILILLQTLSIDASLAPGLSVKNAAIYLIASLLIARIVVQGRFRVDLGGLQASMVFLCAYAILSWLVTLFAIQYPGYQVLESAIQLKVQILDQIIFFMVFFYACSTLDDSLVVTDALLIGGIFANVITVLDASGILGLNVIPIRTDIWESGRVQGAFGEANQHAGVTVMMLPGVIARALGHRGLRRLGWLSGAVFMVAAILMTASRGAMVGIVLASIWGAFIFRRFISFGLVARWAGIGAVLMTIVLLSLSATYTDLLKDRVLGLSLGGSAFTASSGRSEIWATVFNVMLDSPWSLISGFGWGAYSVMGFEYAPHNHYLGTWFNLGLPGLIAFLMICGYIIFTARSAAELAEANVRPMMIAFAVGFLALLISVFFVEMHEPWIYVWIYVGISMRAAVQVEASRRKERASARNQADLPQPRAGGRVAMGMRRPA